MRPTTSPPHRQDKTANPTLRRTTTIPEEQTVFNLTDNRVARAYDLLSTDDRSGGQWKLLNAAQKELLLNEVKAGLGESTHLQKGVTELLNQALDRKEFALLDEGNPNP